MKNLDEFNRRYMCAMENYSAANKALAASDTRIKALEELQKQLRVYGQTKANYKLFKAAKNQDKFLRDKRETEGDIILHEAAKRHFDKYIAEYGKPLPKMSEVTEELKGLKAAKSQQYSAYRAVKSERDIMVKLAVNIQSRVGKDAVREHNADVSI
jgi:hypothetical protein